MKIEVKVSEFKKKVARSLGVIQAKAIIPAFSKVKLEVIAGQPAKMSASDLTASVIQTADVTVKANGEGIILLPAKVVDNMMGNLEGDVLTIETDGDSILLKSKGFKAKLAGMPASQFPAIEQKPATKFSVNNGALRNVISKVEAAAPTKAGRHSVTSIQIESTAAGLRAVASDGFRIAIADVLGAGAGEFVIQLPKSVLGLIKAIPGDVVELSESETNFFFSSGAEQVLVRKPMTKFPPYQKALNLAKFNTDFKLDAEILRRAISGVSATIDGKAPAITISVDGMGLTLSSSNEEGSSEQELTVPVNGVPNTARINQTFINDFLGQAEGEISVQLVDAKNLVKFSNGGLVSSLAPTVESTLELNSGKFNSSVPLRGQRGRFLPLHGDSAHYSLLCRYRGGAKQRKHGWHLSDEQFFRLIEQSCHYCGVCPNLKFIYHSGGQRTRQAFFYNGIDRQNNALGYTAENCVPCCSICNRAKHGLSLFEFQVWMKRVAKCN